MAEAVAGRAPERQLSLRANAVWAFAGTATATGSQWLVAILLGRLFGPAAVGVFALGSAISVPVLIVLQLALRQALVADGARRTPFEDYLRLRLLTSGLACLIIWGVCWGLGHRGDVLAALCAIGLARSIDSVNDIFYGRLQQLRRLDKMSLVMMAQGMLTLALAAAAIIVLHAVVWVCAAFAVSLAATLVVLVLVVGPSDVSGGSSAGRGKRLVGVALHSAPLAIGQGLSAGTANMPRYAIQRFGGAASLGQYAAVEQLMAALSLTVGAVAGAAFPQLAVHHAEGDARRFRAVFLKLVGFNLAVGVAGVAGAVLFGGPVVLLIYGPRFAQAGAAIPWLVAAYALTLIVNAVGVAITAQGRFKAPIPVNALAVLVSAAACFAGVSRWGIVGAAAGVSAAAIAQIVLYLWLLRPTLTATSSP